MEKTPIMFAAIRTKFVGPTNYRGSRVFCHRPEGRGLIELCAAVALLGAFSALEFTRWKAERMEGGTK